MLRMRNESAKKQDRGGHAVSEYQYYEFLAMERPLTREEQQQMRDISSRGHITPVSFSNEYQWGNFKGDPIGLMKRFYDAHVHVADWCTALFMLRVPLAVLDRNRLNTAIVSGVFEAEATATHWILTWNLDESEEYDRGCEVDGSGWMARLSPLRDELLCGDLRPLYIGWLAAVSQGSVDDDESEPCLPEGLAPFSPAQQALAEFLEVDEDLLNGAGLDRPLATHQVAEEDIDSWLASLEVAELRGWVKQLLTGQVQEVVRGVQNRFAAGGKGTDDGRNDGHTRTAGDLWELAERAGEIRQ